MSIVVITIGLILIFMLDLPGSDDVGGGPMTKYKIFTTHFQVSHVILVAERTMSMPLSPCKYTEALSEIQCRDLCHKNADEGLPF